MVESFLSEGPDFRKYIAVSSDRLKISLPLTLWLDDRAFKSVRDKAPLTGPRN